MPEQPKFTDQYNNIRLDNLDSYVSDGLMKDVLDDMVQSGYNNVDPSFNYNSNTFGRDRYGRNKININNALKNKHEIEHENKLDKSMN